MTKILVTYASLSGTTADVAGEIAAELEAAGAQAHVLPVLAVKSIDGYDGVILGGPMIAGYHRNALAFLRKYRKEWGRVPLAVFVCAMSLNTTPLTSIGGTPLSIDDGLPKPTQRPDRLSFRERFTSVEHYAGPILSAIRPAKPLSLAFFGGKLEYGRLPWWGVVFAMFVIQAPAGDKHNMAFVRKWVRGLLPSFNLALQPTGEPVLANG